MHICHSYHTAAHPDTAFRVERTRRGNVRLIITSATVNTYVELSLSPTQAETLTQQLREASAAEPAWARED
jgi:hypothetical protein